MLLLGCSAGGVKNDTPADISVLATALAERVRGDLRRGEIDLFRPASIVVPHANLGRWVCLRLAGELGIAANLEFPYLEGALWRALAGGDALPPRRLDAAKLQQVIYSLFVQPALRDDPAMGPAWAYIGGGAALADEWPPDAQRRAWQLADRVARLFLEYECQRPEMIAAWLDDRLSDDATLDPVMQRWQQRLYHAIFRPAGWRAQTLPQYCTLPQYRATIEFSASPADARPLYFFGLGHTSPFHLDLLCDLARGRDMHLYLCLPPTAHTGAHELLTLWGKSSQQMLTMFDTRRVDKSRISPPPPPPQVLSPPCGKQFAGSLP